MTTQQRSRQSDDEMPKGPSPTRGNALLRYADLVRDLDSHATQIHAQPRKNLFIEPGADADEVIYLVLAGFVVLECKPENERRRILRTLYPGDIFRASFAPPIGGIGLLAAMPSNLLRLKWRKFEDLMKSEKVISDHYHQRLANQEARLALHAGVLGGLTAQARVASLLIEFALCMGQPSTDGVSFDLPLSRAEMADYLALNADTLSRIISRLKSKGVISQSGRQKIFAHNWRALLDESPISKTLVALHGI